VLEEKEIGIFSPLQGADAGSIAYSESVSPTLRTTGHPAVVVGEKPAAFRHQQGSSFGDIGYTEDSSPTLIKNQTMAVVHDVSESEQVPFTVNYDASVKEIGQVTPTLYSTDGINGKTFLANVPKEQADRTYTMTCGSYTQVCEDSASTLMARDYKDPQVVVRPKCIVRRLTPTECLRLQGFDDHWLDEESDTAKYAATGNSVALPCVDYIMQGIAESLYPEDYPQPEPYPIVY